MYDTKTLEALRNKFLKSKYTLAVAESVTAGHLQAAISLAKDTTYFFQGGITAYNLGQKARHLYVNPIEAEENNCVSLGIAEQMALEVCNLFSADIGVAITGYAAPVPQLRIEKLFAYYAISHNEKIIGSGKLTPTGKSIHAIQVEYANKVLKKLSIALK